MATVTVPASGATGFNFLVNEEIYRSREEGVIASGAGLLKSGTVLGKITATGKYKAFTAGASDGTQTAAGILMQDCDATSKDVKRTILVREAEVQRAEILFAGTPTTPQKDAAYASLAVNHVVMR
jgi:hypothetical protein